MVIYLDLKKVFGKNIKYYRFKNKFTQATLSEKAGISSTYLSEVERGQHSVDFDVIYSLAKSLGIEPYELFVKNKNIQLPRRIDMFKNK